MDIFDLFTIGQLVKLKLVRRAKDPYKYLSKGIVHYPAAESGGIFTPPIGEYYPSGKSQ